MEKLGAAIAGGSKPPSPPVAPKSEPATVTTEKDIEQNTYTSERSKQLREGNTSAR
jgi:hypothetical protein